MLLSRVSSSITTHQPSSAASQAWCRTTSTQAAGCHVPCQASTVGPVAMRCNANDRPMPADPSGGWSTHPPQGCPATQSSTAAGYETSVNFCRHSWFGRGPQTASVWHLTAFTETLWRTVLEVSMQLKHMPPAALRTHSQGSEGAIDSMETFCCQC